MPSRFHGIRQRTNNKIAKTNLTNELASAINNITPWLQTGQVQEQVYPVGGGGGTVPSPQFTGQILTGLDNRPVWLLDVYVPALPS